MLFLFVESNNFSSFWQHMPIGIIVKFPHYSELFSFYVVVIYSGSFVCGAVEQHGGGLPVSGLGARPDPFN